MASGFGIHVERVFILHRWLIGAGFVTRFVAGFVAGFVSRLTRILFVPGLVGALLFAGLVFRFCIRLLWIRSRVVRILFWSVFGWLIRPRSAICVLWILLISGSGRIRIIARSFLSTWFFSRGIIWRFLTGAVARLLLLNRFSIDRWRCFTRPIGTRFIDAILGYSVRIVILHVILGFINARSWFLFLALVFIHCRVVRLIVRVLFVAS